MFIWNCHEFVYMKWDVENSNGQTIENKIKLKYDTEIGRKQITNDFMKTITGKLKRTRSREIMKISLPWWNVNLYNNYDIGRMLYWKIAVCGEELDENHFYSIEKKIEGFSKQEMSEFINGIFGDEINKTILPINVIEAYKTKILFIDFMTSICKNIDKNFKYDLELDCFVLI